MDEASTKAAFSITPHVDGKITFEDTQYRMRFTPSLPFEKATIYTVKLAKTASHPDNLSMVEDFTFQFVTKSRNRLALLSSYPNPTHQKVHYNSPTFRLVFDKKLSTGNLQAAVQILDKQRQPIAKNSRSVVNNSIMLPYGSNYFKSTNNLTPGESYFLVVDGAVMDDVGVKLVETIEIPFTAIDATVSDLPVMDAFETASFSFNADNSTGAANASAATTTSTRLVGNRDRKSVV